MAFEATQRLPESARDLILGYTSSYIDYLLIPGLHSSISAIKYLIPLARKFHLKNKQDVIDHIWQYNRPEIETALKADCPEEEI
jgi:hypothetical protein